MSDLKERVRQFQCLELPGQPLAMHMGTSYLVNDLWREIQKLEAERDRLREALVAVSEDDEHGPGLIITDHTLGLVHEALAGEADQ